MSFEIIENLSSEELASLYDDVIEGFTNIAQCVCGVNGLCKASQEGGPSPGGCINATHHDASSTVTREQCRQRCISECETYSFLWYSYRQPSCYGNTAGRYDSYPCVIVQNTSVIEACR